MSKEYSFLLDLAKKGKRVVSDSRKVEPGDIFVALPGTTVDGNEFIQDALSKGAQYVLSANQEIVSKLGEKGIFHPNPTQALGELANSYYFPQGRKIKLIGITGTNGKTTTSYLIAHVLEKIGFKAGIVGTINIRIGNTSFPASLTTPDCLSLYSYLSDMEKKGMDYACIEVSSHALDQDRVAGLEFEAGIFTNLTQDHLDYHKSMEEYFLAKKKMFTLYSSRAVVNGDSEWGKKIIDDLKNKDSITYGFNDYNDIKVLDYIANLKGIEGTVKLKDRIEKIFLPLLGKYNLYNLLACMGLIECLQLSVDWPEVLRSFPGVPGRVEKIVNKKNLNIVVDYAHTPDALENVCKTLRELTDKKLIVVFGCGGNRDKSKRPLMAKAVSKFADMAIVTSDNPRFEEPEKIIEDILPGFSENYSYEVEVDRKKAIKRALELLTPEDLLLIAGKGHEDYQEIKGIRYPFADKKVVQEILNEA
ncbi:MAG: UDP-N-acetylmuramoyl-L-alanyl-D-glutamate--2,6-diaminopimelate ligase [Desulfonauticus sp.]|nr:UDP-N-acetylmuramoyl-L-alanyl-D-glutamate--2,6-diaminopimelate ligase [Desulfonauticus sp.]